MCASREVCFCCVVVVDIALAVLDPLGLLEKRGLHTFSGVWWFLVYLGGGP